MEPVSSPDQVLDWVRAAQDGDEAAFSQLFSRYYEPIRAFAYRVVLDRAAADDIAQETFIRVAQGLSGLRQAVTFEAWLYRIASNVARRWRHREAGLSRRAQAAFDLGDPLATGPAEVNGRDHTEGVGAALAQLSLRQREAVALVYFEELTHAQAAARLGCREATVSWHIHQAKKTLRRLLTP